ncbi:transcription termination factor 2-like isoform X4 [Rhipicephalus microplus]|uniref:transcription termination factor 2-like isoform X4 n=1 Tax=Rhipicephalus microplus TaxID=6941 RepID=UPI003F6A8FFE
MESSGEGGKKTGEQPESVRREKSEAFSRHRGDDRVAGQHVVVMPPAPPLQGSSETKKVAATFPPTTKSREALELEIQKKKKVIGTIKLNTLPDGGRRLKDQLKELEDQLSLLCLSATSNASTKGISAKNTSAAAEHVSRGEERSGMAFERAVQQADTKAELPAPTAKELKKSAPTERGAGKLDTFKDSQPYKNSQTKHSADAHHASLSASRGNDKKPSDRSSEDVGKSNALPKSPEMQRPPDSRDYRAQSSSPKHLPEEGDLSSSKCESSSQCPTGDVSTKGILISPSESAAEADAMGLGKTLTMLSLVEQQRSRDKAHKLAAKIKSNDKTDGKNDSETAAPAPPRGGTLVVCPLSLLHQWEEEVQRHLPGQWQVHVHHGRNRTVDPEELARCDLVVTTYDTISSDWARVDATGKSGLSPLFTVKWRRLVLDEAHNIRNLHTRRAKAACALLAWSRWALTGTPVHNDLNDMRSLLKFLQCHPFDDDSFWKQWVKENPGPEALAVVMKCVLLRRTKEQMGKDGKPLVPLPQKSIILHKLSLEGTEAKVYKELDEWSRSSGPEKYRDPVTGRELYRNVGSRRFVMLIRLQQACSHPALLKKKVLEDAAIDTDELLSAGMAGLQLSDDLAANEDRLDALNLDKYASAQEVDIAYVSCKIKTLLDMLLKVREESNNQDKSVVVSRWTSLLSLVRHHLDRRGIPSVTIQGSVPGHQRASYVAKFNDQREGPTVMLLSLEAGGVGLNLVGGNHMFVLDVHWNPALEAQAFDRIHRVGQTKTVVINRLICADTIEERILELQKHKQQLAESVVARRRLTANDYDFLFAKVS